MRPAIVLSLLASLLALPAAANEASMDPNLSQEALVIRLPDPAMPTIALPADPYVSLSPLEGWTIQLSAPVVFDGNGGLPSAGVSVNRNFPVGQALGWGGGAERLALGLGASVFAPLNFQQLYFGGSLGIGHSTPLGEHFIDYGLRYAPLYQLDFTGNGNAGYNGMLANIGLHLRLSDKTYTTFGLQGGFYIPFSGAGREPIWVLQPIAGLNVTL